MQKINALRHCIISLPSNCAETVEQSQDQSLASGSSPDLLKQPSVRDISTVLGLGGIQNWETYSRKVFVGGLPPEVDEGTIMQKYFAALII